MIRSFVASCLKFRPLVIVIAGVVMVMGLVSLRNMPVDVFPEILPVSVHVHTEALGLSAGEVEQLITVPIEADLLAGTPWVDVMRSESVPGLSSIELVFKPGTDPMHARQVVQERLTQAHALPNVSKPPQMLQPQSSTNRVVMIGLSSKQLSLIEMSVLSRWTIRPRLMGVPGVANVAIWGQRERQLQVQVDPKRLKEKNVSLIQIVKTAGNALWYSPLTFLESSVAGTGGFIETPNQRIGVRHVLPISVAADLAKVPIEGTSMPLDHVATVVEDHQPLIGDASNAAGPALLLVVEKLPGVNTLKVTDDILEAIEALKPGLKGIDFDTNLYRPASYIRTAMGNVANALIVALVLVAVALLALSYNWRAALVGLLGIPLSLAAAFMVLHFAGVTNNAMVLAGLVIALGVLIDDGIAATDNVLRRLRQRNGTALMRVLLDAAFEIRGPLVFATAISLLAVLPMEFMTGAPGAFVKPMVQAYAVAVLASLVVATLFTPVLCYLLLGNTPIAQRESPFSAWLKRRFEAGPLAAKVAFPVAVAATILGVALLPMLRVPAAPAFKEPDVLVRWSAMPGTSRTEMNRLIERASQELRTIPGVGHVGSLVGRAIFSDQVVGMSSSELWVSLDPKADYHASVAAIRDAVRGYPGIDAHVTTYLGEHFGDALSSVEKPVVVRLYGQRADVLMSEAEKVQQSLAKIGGIVNPTIHLQPTEPVVEIQVNLDAAAALGVKPGDVRRSAAALLAGIEVGNLFEEQKIFEVVVWGEPQVRHSVESIHDMLVDAPGGRHVRLGDLATVRIVPAVNVIHRENVARIVDVVAGVSGRSVNAVNADVTRMIRGTAFPLEYRAELVGDYTKQQQGRGRVIAAAIAVAIGIVFIYQASVGSWALALGLLLALPVALAGSAIAAAATGATLSLGSMAGLLTVAGLAVRHGVLLVNRYRDLKRDGMDGAALVIEGTRERAPAILMSTLVTAAAVLPFAVFGARAGLEVLGPMAVVILGGLVTVSLHSLCIVPWLYARIGASIRHEAMDDDGLDFVGEPEPQPLS